MSSAGDQRRFALTLHYDGSGFHGWQVQPGLRTVQGDVEAVIERLTGGRRAVTGSGRTDAGVHATGQVAAVDMPSRWTSERLRAALNGLLADDVWVEAVAEVEPDFHPRYAAVARTYRYRVGLAEVTASPLHRRWCWALGEALDRDALDAGAARIVGEHSFRSFAKTGQPERGERCRVSAARWSGWDELGVTFEVTADRYLHHMVRYLVGTMVDVGRGRRPLEDVGTLLEDPGGDMVTSPPAPPEGLFLARVDYPPGALARPPGDGANARARGSARDPAHPTETADP